MVGIKTAILLANLAFLTGRADLVIGIDTRQHQSCGEGESAEESALHVD